MSVHAMSFIVPSIAGLQTSKQFEGWTLNAGYPKVTRSPLEPYLTYNYRACQGRYFRHVLYPLLALFVLYFPITIIDVLD